ncbi:Hypothetical protein I596_2328 [Dokdonella koreensis DS-123]|uniref:Uncharacterized protein n=1 Tax=Dokdonella koreensis DS-123 TaxID=1300342 RepID=A0A160DUZ7_9GAMM|nr:Hypothetical protein I596_2328 [Dokdonella koreensis DS-123]
MRNGPTGSTVSAGAGDAGGAMTVPPGGSARRHCHRLAIIAR